MRASANNLNLTAKKPQLISEYTKNFYTQVGRPESRQAQSVETLKSKNEDVQAQIRELSAPVPLEWATTEEPSQILARLETALPRLDVQAMWRRSRYLFELTLAKQLYVGRPLKCEVELMVVRSAPFVTVLRVNQQLSGAAGMDAKEKRSRLA